MGVFGPGFLLDPSTMLPVAGRVVAVTDPDTGEPVTTTEADGTTPRTVVTNLHGHYPQFHVASTWAVLLSAGGVEEVVAAIDRDPGGASSLSDLADVDTTGVQDGDVLVRDGGQWVAGSGTSGTGILNVSGTVDLDDVDGLVEVYATASATVEGVSLAAGDAAVFRYLSGEWTYMVVGEHTTWQTIEAAPIPVTADAPTWTDDTENGGGSWTTPTITGVTYSPASGTATPGQSVTVTATAQPGYTLTGTTSWTHTFPTDPGDTTDPTPGTLSASAVTDTSFTLTVTGASDDTGLHAQPYAFSLDGGTTWTGWQASATYNATDLDDDTTYPCRHKVRDAALNEALGTTVNVTTEATPTPSGPTYAETFTRPDTTSMTGLTTEVGAATISNPTPDALLDAGAVAPAVVTGGRAVNTGGSASEGMMIDPVGVTAAGLRVSVDYDVTASGHSARQVRIALGTFGQFWRAVVKPDGTVTGESNAGGLSGSASSQPTTGNLALEITATKARVLVNDTELFATSGTYPTASIEKAAALAHRTGMAFDNFEVTLL